MIMLTFRYFRRQRSDEIPEMPSFFFCFFAQLGVFSSPPFDLLVSKLSHTWVFFLYHVKTMFVVLSFNTFCNTHISIQRLSSTGIVWLLVLGFFLPHPEISFTITRKHHVFTPLPEPLAVVFCWREYEYLHVQRNLPGGFWSPYLW